MAARRGYLVPERSPSSRLPGSEAHKVENRLDTSSPYPLFAIRLKNPATDSQAHGTWPASARFSRYPRAVGKEFPGRRIGPGSAGWRP